MTRKDYQRFADMFAGEVALHVATYGRYVDGRFTVASELLIITIRNLILSTADIFAQDNPRFNRQRFYTACGVDEMGWPR